MVAQGNISLQRSDPSLQALLDSLDSDNQNENTTEPNTDNNQTVAFRKSTDPKKKDCGFLLQEGNFWHLLTFS